MVASSWQQILAVDAKCNAFRAQNNLAFRSLYIRRRSQLLRENSKKSKDFDFCKEYLRLRIQLLAERYGYQPSTESGSRSRSVSILSGSQPAIDTDIENAAFMSIDSHRSPVEDKSDVYTFSGIHNFFEHHKDSITRLCFAHDEKFKFAAASMDGCISVVEISEQTEKSLMLQKLIGHTDGIVDIAWSVSNDLLVSCSLDRTIRLWHPFKGECLRIVEDITPVLCCIFQPLNNNFIVTGNMSGAVQVLNISTGKFLNASTYKLAGATVCMCCDSSGKLMWVGDKKGFVLSFIIDSTLGKLIKGRSLLVASNSSITSLSCRPWNVVVGSSKKTASLLLISATTNAVYLYVAVDSSGLLQPKRRIPLHHARLTIHSNFCPLMSFRQGAYAISGSENGYIHLFNVESNDRTRDLKLKGHAVPVIDVCFNHDESFLISGDSKGKIIVWRKT